MFPSYRNQSVDLQSKSTDWFLYDWSIGRYRVKQEYDGFSSVTSFFNSNFTSKSISPNTVFQNGVINISG